MRHIKQSPVLVVGLLAGLCLAVGLTATAGEGEETEVDPTVQVIPYDGLLELDGEAINGNYRLRFTLYEHPSNTAPSRWQDTLSVEVVRGRFTALLGTEQPLPADLLRNPVLYLGFEIEDPGTPDAFFQLANRQRIVPTPFAYVAAAAPDFLVSESLRVEQDATVDRDLNVSGQTSLAGLTVGGHGTVASLTVSGDTDVSDLDVTGALDVTGSLTLNGTPMGNLQVSGPWWIDRYNTAGASVRSLPVSNDRSICFLDRVWTRDVSTTYGYADCRVYKGSTQWQLSAGLGESSVVDLLCSASCLTW